LLGVVAGIALAALAPAAGPGVAKVAGLKLSQLLADANPAKSGPLSGAKRALTAFLAVFSIFAIAIALPRDGAYTRSYPA
jgi:hypothetical protein